MPGQSLVFVYGTLLRGEANHHFLRGAVCLGRGRTAPAYRMFTLGSYPVVCPGGQQSIHGEVYRVSRATLAGLDELEECPHYYRRRLIDTAFGRAWLYFQEQAPPGARRLPAGSWRREQGRHRHRFAGCPRPEPACRRTFG